MSDYTPRCRWCRGAFVRVYTSQWLCENPVCQQRQIASSELRRQGTLAPDQSPYLYLKTPFQVEVSDCLKPNLFGGGAAGGSKSFIARWDTYEWCRKIPGYEALLLRRSYPELEETHLLAMAREAESIGAKYLKGERRLIWEDTGSFIKAGHCESASDMSKMLSREYDHIVFDEGSTFLQTIILEISSRARSSKQAVIERGGAFVRIFSNPGGPGALFLRDFFIDKRPDPRQFPDYRPDDYAFIQASVTDNPYLDPAYTNRLKQLAPARRKQLLDGDWDVFAGQFFPMFSKSTHVVSMQV